MDITDKVLDIIFGVVQGALLLVLTIYVNVRITDMRAKNKTEMDIHLQLIEDEKRKNDATQSGVQALMRNAIVAAYERGDERGFVPIYDRENIDHLYNEYRNLGGNGVIQNLIDKINSLPTNTPNKYKNQKRRVTDVKTKDRREDDPQDQEQ